jgi:pentatricopeptide repeat protein
MCVAQAKGWEGMKMDLTIYNIVINSYAMEKDFAGAARYHSQALHWSELALPSPSPL